MATRAEVVAQLQTSLDDAMIQGLTSGWMDINNDDVRYVAGKEVKIPVIGMSGLGDYDRTKRDAYPDANVSLEYQTVTMTQDRGTRITVDAMDRDETQGLLDVSKLMSKFQREKVIPEVDAYRYSTIAQHCIKNERVAYGYTPDASTLLTQLYLDIARVQDIVGEDTPLVVTISMMVAAMFDLSKELGKRLETTQFTTGNVNLKVKALDGQIPMIRVGSGRMKTEYEFFDGRTPSDGAESNPSPDQTMGGFKPTAAAKDINWLITPVTAPIAITRQDKVRIFDPNTNQTANAWATDYRRYHDLWIKNSSLPAIYANIKQAK